MDALTKKNPCSDNRMKSVLIPSPYAGVKMLLTGTEAEQLFLILEQADSAFRTNKLLDLFI